MFRSFAFTKTIITNVHRSSSSALVSRRITRTPHSMTTAETPRRTSSRIASRSGAEQAAPAAPAVAETKKRAAPSAGVKTSAATKTAEKTEDTDTKKAKGNGSSGTLKVGDALPSITLQDESGKDVDIAALKKSVLFTYPKANTPGCTTQACLFRDEYAEFQKAGFAVYGLSNDGLTSLKNWKEKKEFPYSLLSDPKRDLIGALTGSKSSTQRSHFVIDADGKLALSTLGVKPAESSPATLKFAQGL